MKVFSRFRRYFHVTRHVSLIFAATHISLIRYATSLRFRYFDACYFLATPYCYYATVFATAFATLVIRPRHVIFLLPAAAAFAIFATLLFFAFLSYAMLLAITPDAAGYRRVIY